MLIHSDVWGPSKVTTLGGSRWFVTFIDDCTRMTWLCLMKSKTEVNSIFQKFHKMVETQYNAKIQILHSDNGGEYQNIKLQQYLEAQGMIHHTTCPNTPQQNRVTEQKNRHLLEVVRALLIDAHMSLSCWGEALTAVAYLINRVPSNTINFKTPFQIINEIVDASSVPNLPPYVFGCVVFVHLHKHQCTKLTPQAVKCVFVGYATHQKGYRCYHPPTRRLFVTMDVIFHEDTMYFSEPECQGEYRKEIQTLNYDENGNMDVINLDLSGPTLDFNDDDSQTRQNQEVGELTLDQGIAKEVGLPPTQPHIEILKNMATPLSDIPHHTNHLLKIILSHTKKSYHNVKIEVFLNPHMNLNCVVK